MNTNYTNNTKIKKNFFSGHSDIIRIFRVGSRQGSFLVETMVAISLIIVGLLGIISFLTNSFGFNNEARNRFVGSYLAAEGIEIVKNIIDTNISQGFEWNNGIDDGSYEADYLDSILNPNNDDFLIFNEENGYLYEQAGTSTIFKRPINIQILTGSMNEPIIKVNSVVNWTDRGRDYSVNLEDQFYNWRQ